LEHRRIVGRGFTAPPTIGALCITIRSAMNIHRPRGCAAPLDAAR